MDKLQENLNTTNEKSSENEENSPSNKVSDHLNINSYRRVKNSLESKNEKIFTNKVKFPTK